MLRRTLLRAGQLKPYTRASSSVTPPSHPSPLPAGSPPPAIPPQAPNAPAPWSTSQRPRPGPASEPRFEQTAMDLQPAPLSAMELIGNEPVRLVEGRRAVCDGGGGPLGHPKIFINLDKPGPKACGYWRVHIATLVLPGVNHVFATVASVSSKMQAIITRSFSCT